MSCTVLCCCSCFDDLSVLKYPFSSSFFGLSDEETRDVELIQNLLASAEKVWEQQFECASKLLNYCHEYSSKKGSHVQRLVYYFSEALRHMIEQQTGRRTLKDLRKMQSLALMDPSSNTLAFYQQVPFSKVSLFTAMQAVIENVSETKEIHIIDIEIRCGLQFSILMEALAGRSEYPVEHLKITAIGTKSKHKIKETAYCVGLFLAHKASQQYVFVEISQCLTLVDYYALFSFLRFPRYNLESSVERSISVNKWF